MHAVIRKALVTLMLAGFGLAPALADGTAAPATSALDAVSIGSRAWSGEIDDARAGRGSIAIRLSSDGGTFVASFCCNMGNTGIIINEVLHAALAKTSTPSPQAVANARHARGYSDALMTASEKASRNYCKAAAPVACSFYQEAAAQCLSTAMYSYTVYQVVLAMKKSGFTSEQAVEQEADSHGGPDSDAAFIAAAAVKIIYGHERFDSTLFSTAMLRVCLADIAK